MKISWQLAPSGQLLLFGICNINLEQLHVLPLKMYERCDLSLAGWAGCMFYLPALTLCFFHTGPGTGDASKQLQAFLDPIPDMQNSSEFINRFNRWVFSKVTPFLQKLEALCFGERS